MRVAMFSAKPYDRQFFEEQKSKHEFVYLEPRLNAQTARLAADCNAVCCFVNDQLSAEVLEALHRMGVRLVALRCAGFNQVDTDAAKRLQMTVCRVPEYSPYAVAEHAVGLILTLNRNLHRAYNRIREHDYSLHGLMGFDLHGKTVGVIGAGKIGRAFIRIMNGFGCSVLVSDPVEDPEIAALANYTSVSDLCTKSDIVSLHCPLTPSTHHLINAETIRQMKRGVMIINTSRGGLLDTYAAIQGLKSGQIGHLGLDVYEEEADIFFENLSDQVVQDDVFARLTTFPNVVVTGHQAFFTSEALNQIAAVTVANLTGFEQNDQAAMSLVG